MQLYSSPLLQIQGLSGLWSLCLKFKKHLTTRPYFETKNTSLIQDRDCCLLSEILIYLLITRQHWMWLSNPVSLFDFMESPVVDIFSVRTEVLSVQPMAAALNYFSTQSCIHAPQVTLIEFGTCTVVYLLGIVLIISCVSLISDFNHIEISWGGAVAHVRSNKRPVSLYTCL